ncbi:hypothetical protein NMY22_g11175 [Coprinellus aureogranulatus]|nr:hypothetical protein NMY22_g11175 [Coprinellus aureogranulatus]
MSASTPEENAGPPPWFMDAVKHLQIDELGETWKDAVEKWIALETLLGYGKVAKTPLPVSDRPTEWTKWASKTKNNVRPYDSIPKIDQPAEFGLAMLKWWYNIQPPFRSSTNNFPGPMFEDPSYEGDPWVAIRKSGPNGFVVLMTLMSWWGRSLSNRNSFVDDSRPAWNLLVDDIRRCLVEMVKPVLQVGAKRDRAETIESPELQPSKRQKT